MNREYKCTPNLRDQMAVFNGNPTDPNASFANISNPLNVTCPARILNATNDTTTLDATIFEDGDEENVIFQQQNPHQEQQQHRQEMFAVNEQPIALIGQNNNLAVVEQQQVRRVSPTASQMQPQICESYKRLGFCPYANHCQFEHVDTNAKRNRVQQRNTTFGKVGHKRYASARYCRNYENGKCNYGNKCRFIHRQTADHKYVATSQHMQNAPQMFHNMSMSQVSQPMANQSFCQQNFSIIDMNQTMPIFTSNVPFNNKYIPNIPMDHRFPPPPLMQVQPFVQPPCIQYTTPPIQDNITYYPVHKYNPYFN